MQSSRGREIESVSSQMRFTVLIVAFVACAASIHAPDHRQPLAGRRRAINPTAQVELVAAKKAETKPHAVLPAAYAACGLATTAAWTRIVFTTIRSNQPLGMMMPTYQHGLRSMLNVPSWERHSAHPFWGSLLHTVGPGWHSCPLSGAVPMVLTAL